MSLSRSRGPAPGRCGAGRGSASAREGGGSQGAVLARSRAGERVPGAGEWRAPRSARAHRRASFAPSPPAGPRQLPRSAASRGAAGSASASGPQLYVGVRVCAAGRGSRASGACPLPPRVTSPHSGAAAAVSLRWPACAGRAERGATGFAGVCPTGRRLSDGRPAACTRCLVRAPARYSGPSSEFSAVN